MGLALPMPSIAIASGTREADRTQINFLQDSHNSKMVRDAIFLITTYKID